MKQYILKYLNDNLTDEEYNELSLWLKNPENKKKFKKFIQANYNLSLAFNKIDDSEALKKVKSTIEKHNKKGTRKLYYKYAIAAILVGVLLTTTLFFNVTTNTNTPIEQPAHKITNTVTPGEAKAILTLENGSDIILNEKSKYESQNSKNNSDGIVYNNNPENNSLEFNYLTIPRGGQYALQLSDGTKVWLNSETKLKYPITFIEGQPRDVELIYGEAYFEVSPSSKHQGSLFSVKTKLQEIQVLGTAFNIKAYQDENQIQTTLVHGKVALNTEKEHKQLSPNQQSVLNKETGDLIVKKVDVYSEISWKDGLFSFKSKSLKEIMTVLSRWYNIEFNFEDIDSEKLMFNGVLKKNQSLEEILEVINKTNLINAYEINDNIIIIK
ncbi:FecR family protein [Aestuariibaculum suncheonense]|uniref:FecR family protein n=1 Tax=Aestuariibaculum suncheonense TaxID=1028745 RepID=A0A8J6UAJ7_9FLAO|nr:FecR family protein [Aestuariibaculum suncheonense]MBD0835378.1 FecR family protein [Aestuariibaculum suncheonense]